MPFGGLLTMGLIAGVGSLASGVIGAGAASTAAGEQAQSAQEALDFQKQMWATQQGNVAPYLATGTNSIGNLMRLIGQGVPAAPAPYTGTFTAPTLQQAQQTPGYQFTAQQGTKGILEAAGAAGGAITGGTLKAADVYNTGLADSTYNDVFNRSLATYNTGVQAYQTNLAQYQAQLQAQAQQFGQTALPVQLGASAASGLNLVGSGVASNAGNLMTQIGNAQASGTVGTSNALTGGLTGATTDLTQAAMLKALLSRMPGQVGPYGTVTDPSTLAAINNGPGGIFDPNAGNAGIG